MCIKYEHSVLNNYNELEEIEKARDSRKSPMECAGEKPQALDQSNKEPRQSSIIFPIGFSMSSKVRHYVPAKWSTLNNGKKRQTM